MSQGWEEAVGAEVGGPVRSGGRVGTGGALLHQIEHPTLGLVAQHRISQLYTNKISSADLSIPVARPAYLPREREQMSASPEKIPVIVQNV